MILGVSGWLGDKLNIQASYIRIGFVVAFFGFGVGLGIYLICWILKLLSKD